VALVLDALRGAGAVAATAEERLAHEAGTPIAAAALADLARAETVRAAEVLLDQAGGALDREARRLRSLLAEPTGAEGARAGLDALLARSAVGVRLLRGWRIALAGRPNVGKSRLLNALAGFERAIVSPAPGTTRDVVTAHTALDGWPVEVADTAGLREASDPVEAAGVALARSRQAGADLVVLVLDRSEPLADADHALRAALPSALAVASKADLPAAWDEAMVGALAVSAERGDGLGALVAALGRRLVPEPPPPGSAVPWRPGQARVLVRARDRLAEGRPGRASAWLARLGG
jgi:tRNA modification GTPase